MTRKPRVKDAGDHWGPPLSQKHFSPLCARSGAGMGPRCRQHSPSIAPGAGTGPQPHRVVQGPLKSQAKKPPVSFNRMFGGWWPSQSPLEDSPPGREQRSRALGTAASPATHRVSDSRNLLGAPPPALQRPPVALSRDKAEETMVSRSARKEGAGQAQQREERGRQRPAQTGTGGGAGRSQPGQRDKRKETARGTGEDRESRQAGGWARWHTPGIPALTRGSQNPPGTHSSLRRPSQNQG